MSRVVWRREAPATSPLAARNPAVKLGVLFALSVGVLFWLDPVRPTFAWALLLVGTVAGARVPTRPLVAAQVALAGFALGTLLVNIVARPGDPHAVGLAISLAARTMVIGTASVAFIASTDAVSLVSSLHQNARLPARLAYPLLAGYRMLEELPREWELLAAAHAVRDVRSRTRPGVTAVARRTFALLVITIRKGERLAHSLELRGLDRQPRTVWRRVRVSAADWALAAGVTAAYAAVAIIAAPH